jgi:nucleoside-diphosphate kinase
MVSPDKNHYHTHYEDIGKMITRHNQKTFDITVEMMLAGPVIAIVLEGVEAISVVRKIVGSTEPKNSLPGTIRGDYSHMSYDHANKNEIGVPNIVHASGDESDAKAEIAHWFKPSEMFDYKVVHEQFTQANNK